MEERRLELERLLVGKGSQLRKDVGEVRLFRRGRGKGCGEKVVREEWHERCMVGSLDEVSEWRGSRSSSDNTSVDMCKP